MSVSLSLSLYLHDYTVVQYATLPLPYYYHASASSHSAAAAPWEVRTPGTFALSSSCMLSAKQRCMPSRNGDEPLEDPARLKVPLLATWP